MFWNLKNIICIQFMIFLFLTLTPIMDGVFFCSHFSSLCVCWIIHLFLLILTKELFHHSCRLLAHHSHHYHGFLLFHELLISYPIPAPGIILQKYSYTVWENTAPHMDPDHHGSLNLLNICHYKGWCQGSQDPALASKPESVVADRWLWRTGSRVL